MRRSKQAVAVLLLTAAGRCCAGNSVPGLPGVFEARYRQVLAGADLESPLSLQFANDLDGLAQADARTGYPQRIETMVRTLLSSASGRKSSGFATFESTLGIALVGEGKLKSAAAAFRAALRLRESVLEPNHLHIAESLNNLALVNRKLHRLKDSERDYRRAIEILRAIKHRPELAAAIHNLARVRADQGRIDEAKSLIEEAIAVWQDSLGPNHDDVAEGWASLATLDQTQHRYAEAARAYRRALEIFSKSRAPTDPRLIGVLDRYSAVLRAQEEYAEAAKIDMQAMRIRVANSLRGPR
jgi:tetratricopeptide (TPR) repeat protein